MTFLGKLSKFLKPEPVEILRPRAMSDTDLLNAMAVPQDHPILQAFLELIDRARIEARAEAKSVIKSDRETVFALGGENALDNLENYFLALRAEAVKRAQGASEV